MRRIVLAALVATVAGCGGTKAEVASVILSKGRSASERQATKPFVTGEGVHAFVTIKNDSGGAKLRGRVTAVFAEGRRKGEVLDVMTRTTVAEDGPTYDLAYDEAPLGPGTYEFAIWLDAPTDQPPTQSVKFKVVAKEGDKPVAEATPAPEEDPLLAASPGAGPADTGEAVVAMGPFQEIYLTRGDTDTTEMASRAFQDPIKTIWCNVTLERPKPGQVVIVRWVAEQVAGARREQVLHESRAMLPKGVAGAQFPLKGDGGGALPKGKWRVDLQRREALDAEARVRFTIE